MNLRDRLDEAHETYRRLGFTMTPRGHHTLGSMNLWRFLEPNIWSLSPPGPAIPDGRKSAVSLRIEWPGVWHRDSDAVYTALDAAGIAAEPPLQFSRPVELSSGARDATFRTVRLKPGVIDAGRVYFCHHFTRDLVWRDEWRHMQTAWSV